MVLFGGVWGDFRLGIQSDYDIPQFTPFNISNADFYIVKII